MMLTVTGAPVKLGMNERRQQSGRAAVGATVGKILYSVPGSTTETVTGAGCNVGVKVKRQVSGCPTAELEDQGGGAKVHKGRVAVNIRLHCTSLAGTDSEGGTLYLPALAMTCTLDTGGAAIMTNEP